MSWLAIPDPQDRLPLTTYTFLTRLMPALICYYVMAVLVLLKNTTWIRRAFLPIALWTGFTGATTLNFTLGHEDPGLTHLNFGLCLALLAFYMRVVEWAAYLQPLKRISISHQDVGRPTPDEHVSHFGTALWDAFDLCTNLRGLGWNWSIGLNVPKEARPTTSTTAFTIATLWYLTKAFVIGDSLQYTLQHFYPSAMSPTGGSIFDPTLSPLPRYAHSCFITFIGITMLACGIYVFYYTCTLIGILVFQQSPSQWPPLFDEPWKATSQTSFWAKRWHQGFRQSFVILGSTPLYLCFGRLGGVLGAFLISGLLHDWSMWGFGQGLEPANVMTSFLMMGVAVILEYAWKRVVGTRVGGGVGWVWTMSWGTVWMQLQFDAWARRGFLGGTFRPEWLRPIKYVVWIVQSLY